jgi:hypothetical protein
VKEFYSPKYGRSLEEDKIADYRSTIYWNPNLRTNNEGEVTFEYFNADKPGTYRMVIEGISSRGNLGRKIYRYQVTD